MKDVLFFGALGALAWWVYNETKTAPANPHAIPLPAWAQSVLTQNIPGLSVTRDGGAPPASY